MNMIMVNAVKAHAKANYGKDGWDMVVECFSDEEIWERIKDCPTLVLAIREISLDARLWAEQRRTIRAEMF